MKKWNFLLLVILAGCSQNNSATQGLINSGENAGSGGGVISLQASWVNASRDITLTFNKNGTYLYNYDDRDYRFSENGIYSISGNTLNAKDSDGFAYTETVKVINNKLTLTDKYGYSQVFEKKG